MRDATKVQATTNAIDYTATRFHTCIPSTVPKAGNALTSQDNILAVKNAQRQLA